MSRLIIMWFNDIGVYKSIPYLTYILFAQKQMSRCIFEFITVLTKILMLHVPFMQQQL